MGEPVQNSGASALTELELQILEFERQWWRYPGSKEAAIRELFSMSTPRSTKVTLAVLASAIAAVRPRQILEFQELQSMH